MTFPTIDHARIAVSHDATRTGILNLGAEGEQDAPGATGRLGSPPRTKTPPLPQQ